MRVLVTGANGFVGRHVVNVLSKAGLEVRAASRTPITDGGIPSVRSVELTPETDWSAALRGQDAVVHLAARAHVFEEDERDAERLYMRQNCDATLELARQAFEVGIGRFVFVSSAGVGGGTGIGRPITEQDEPNPSTPYARSKLAAEYGLKDLAHAAKADYVIVRPALVHGPGAPGNLRRLMNLISLGLPLPFASVRNKRSLVGVQNLAELIRLCLFSDRAAGGVFYAVDDDSISTPDMIRALAGGMGRPARLFAVPQYILSSVAAMVGRRVLYQQICGDLEYDGRRARVELGWHPRLSITEGLFLTGCAFSGATHIAANE